MTFAAARPDMHANNALLWTFAVANAFVALGITLWVLRRQRAHGQMKLGVSVLVGGLLSPLVCPLWDVLSHVRHAEPADTVVVSFFDHRVVTAWNFLAYYWFIGALGLFAYQMIRSGAGVRQLWRLWAVVAVADILLEVPLQLVNRNIYTYVGNHPFYSYDYFPLPLFCILTNAACPLATASVIVLFRSTHIRGYLFALPFAVASAWFGIFYAMPGWMYWTALGSNASLAVMYPVSIVGFAVFLFLYHLIATATVSAVRAGLTDEPDQARRAPARMNDAAPA